ncbi:MAG: nucleotidyltransferase domain-containing protein [Bacteroidales bacterium]|nr:nucleotidyltransferase domain-containing protein [Bacteroidales bacterium]MCF8458259.1 nucleotidyltransferase domain-containing protein [Bacteroidales bacterium]
MAQREVIEMLQKYIALLKLEGIPVRKAFLFGSYSTNTASDTSDIDVMIISDKYDETDDLIIGKVWKLTKKVSTKIEPLLIGFKKFNNDSSSPLISLVKSAGIEIV